MTAAPLDVELAQVLAVYDGVPTLVVPSARDAWEHRGLEVELLELEFDSDRTESLSGGRTTRLVVFAGPLTLLSVRLRREGDLLRLTAYLEDAEGVELAVSGPESPPQVVGSISDEHLESVLLHRGPIRFWLRAPGGAWRSASEWLLVLPAHRA